MKDRIAKRIAKANEEYKENKRTKRNKTEAAFYPSDICAALKNAGGEVQTRILTALEAGFMIGYRKGRNDQKRIQRRKLILMIL